MQKQPFVLVVLDGWGIGPNDSANPIHVANPKNINGIKLSYPFGALQASGIAVGLPWGENGDSEVGHLTIGAGKTLYQHYPRISLKIKDGTFSKNENLLYAINEAKRKNTRVHLIGLLGKSNLYSSVEHLEKLIELTAAAGVEAFLHAITDGRDSPPKSAGDIIADLPQIKIASVIGRYYAMDRDLHWDRTLKAYGALTGKKEFQGAPDTPQNTLNSFYSHGLTDEFIAPTLINEGSQIKDGDSVIFFNFREDVTKQLAEMFQSAETGEKHEIPKDLCVVTLTEYSNKLNFPVAFPADKILSPLGKVLADRGLVQLRIAETEKYAHVTYFFNGLVETPFTNEYRVVIPSKNIARHDEEPEMMAQEITTRIVEAIGEGVYDFILVNYANADMIGHTGNFDAAIRAVNVIDEQIGMLKNAILKENGTLLITADHGNVENMVDPKTGLPESTHDPNPVPIYIVRNGYERTKSDDYVTKQEKTNIGTLADIAPTVLELMGIQKPSDMTGLSLLQSVR